MLIAWYSNWHAQEEGQKHWQCHGTDTDRDQEINLDKDIYKDTETEVWITFFKNGMQILRSLCRFLNCSPDDVFVGVQLSDWC
jgi:hypothetical protein